MEDEEKESVPQDSAAIAEELIAEDLSVEDIVSMEPEFISELKSTGERFLRFFIDIGTSGKYWKDKTLCTSDYLIRYALINFFTTFGSMLLIGFFIANMQMGLHLEAAICIFMLVMAIASFALARMNVRLIIPSVLMSFSYGVFCVSLIWNGEINGANSLTIFVYPLITITMMGIVYGILFSAALLAFVVAELFVPGVSHYEYNFDVASRTVISYVLVLSVMAVIEFTRRTKDSLMRIQARKLNELNDMLSYHSKEIEAPAKKPAGEQVGAANASSGLNIKSHGTAQFVPFSEVSHVEVIDHLVYIKMRNKSLIKVYTTFSNIEEQLLHDGRFVRCHRSYIINVNEVANLSKSLIVMNNGTKINISRNFAQVKDVIEKMRGTV